MNSKRTTLIIAEISILAALALAFDYIAQVTTGSIYIYGGSISIAMVPIMVISFRRGLLAGLTTGLIVGTIQVMWGGHVLQFFQYILDYPIPYMVVGSASIFTYLNKRKINYSTLIVGSIFAGLARYFSHFLAGVVFWSEYVPDEFKFGNKNLTGFNAYSWSIFYNALYMIPTIVVSVIVVAALYKYARNLFVLEDQGESTIKI